MKGILIRERLALLARRIRRLPTIQQQAFSQRCLQMLLCGAKPLSVLQALESQCAQLSFLPQKTSPKAQAGMEILQRLSAWTICFWEEAYPPLLREISDPPLILFGRGKKEALRRCSLAIVGTRKPSDYGRFYAGQWSRLLAEADITVVSGLAHGIDGQAHRGALAGGGTSIGVLAGGIDRIYPAVHRELAQQLCEKGAILTEQIPGTPPLPHHFLTRNRILSGLSRGAVVIEGQARSGTMITVRCALAQGRDVFALPGDIGRPQSEGPNLLIQWGAKAVTSVEQILEEIPRKEEDAPGECKKCTGIPKQKKEVTLSKTEQLVYDTLDSGSCSVDEILSGGNMTLSQVLAALTRLEQKGWIRRDGPGRIARSR